MLNVSLKDQIGSLNLEVSFTVPPSTYVVMLGPSGAGKSHTLKILAGLRKARWEEIKLQGQDISSLPPEKRNIVYLPQQNTLFPHLNVEENILFAFRARREKVPPNFVREVVDTFRLAPFLKRGVKNLSGGEAQRVALARALCARPKVLLLDEPLASLDFHLKWELLDFLKLLPQRFKLSILHVTHDPWEAAFLAERLLLLEGGKILFEGDFSHFLEKGPGALGQSLKKFFSSEKGAFLRPLWGREHA